MNSYLIKSKNWKESKNRSTKTSASNWTKHYQNRTSTVRSKNLWEKTLDIYMMNWFVLESNCNSWKYRWDNYLNGKESCNLVKLYYNIRSYDDFSISLIFHYILILFTNTFFDIFMFGIFFLLLLCFLQLAFSTYLEN